MATAGSLIGIVSLLGGGVVEGALRYANVIRYRFITAFIVVPGLYNVSIRLLRRCNNCPARVLSPGDRENRRKILGFESSNSYRYVGMHSGTNAFVVNALFESWLNVSNRELSKCKSAMIRTRPKMGSRSTLGFTKCRLNYSRKDDAVINIYEPFYLVVPIILELAAVTAFVFMVKLMDIAGIVINLINMCAYFLINIFVTIDKFYVPIPEPSDKVPPGNMLVTDKSNNNMWAVVGDESDIQSIAQKEVIIKICTPEIAETVVYIFGSLVAVATILVVPIMSNIAQIYIAAQFGIGLVSSILFSSRDGEMMLKRLLEKHYIMNDTRIITFTNRATTVAAAAFFTSANVEYIHSNMVPGTDDYKKYRMVLQEVIKSMNAANTSLYKLACSLKADSSLYWSVQDNDDPKKAAELRVTESFVVALPEAESLLPGGVLSQDNLNTWPGRLLMDIVEAFVEVYVVAQVTHLTMPLH